MDEYLCRSLTSDDVEKFRKLRRAVVTLSSIGLGTTSDEESQQPLQFFQRKLSFEAPSQVFGAFLVERLVATAGIRWPTQHSSGKHKTILHNVQTAPDFRQRSLARRLVESAVSHAFREGCLRIYLYVYLPNVEAVSLYESLGFVASGAEPEELCIENRYFDLQYMSLQNPFIAVVQQGSIA